MKQLRLSQVSETGRVVLESMSEDSEESEKGTLRDFHAGSRIRDRSHYWATNLLSSRDSPTLPVIVKVFDVEELKIRFQIEEGKEDFGQHGAFFFDPYDTIRRKSDPANVKKGFNAEQISELLERARNLLDANGSSYPQTLASLAISNSHIRPHDSRIAIDPLRQGGYTTSAQLAVPPLCLHSKRILKKSRARELEESNLRMKCESVLALKQEKGLSIKQIATRLKMSSYKVNSVLKNQRAAQCGNGTDGQRRMKFKKLTQSARTSIVQFVEGSQSLLSARDIQVFLKQSMKLDISRSHLIRYLKQVLGYSFKRYGIVTPNQNSLECKLQRQIAARTFIDISCQGKIIINIDESVLQTSDNRRYGWGLVGQRTKEVFRQRLPSMNTTAAVSSKGDVYFTLNHGKTNSLTFIHFLDKLISFLDSRQDGWRRTHVLMIDNAPYNRSRLTRAYFKRHQLPIMYLGPYSFHMAPVEKIFSFFKNRDLNPHRHRVTSKEHLTGFMQQCGRLLRGLDYSWVAKSYSHAIAAACQFLSLNDI